MDIDGWGVVDIWATGLGKDTKGTLFSDRIGSFFYFTGVSMHSILYINETIIPNINANIYITITRKKNIELYANIYK
jgi:hypothetical protein